MCDVSTLDTFQCLSTGVRVDQWWLVLKRLFFVYSTCILPYVWCMERALAEHFFARGTDDLLYSKLWTLSWFSLVFSAVMCVAALKTRRRWYLGASEYVLPSSEAQVKNTPQHFWSFCKCWAVVFVLKRPGCFVFRHDSHSFLNERTQCRKKLLPVWNAHEPTIRMY